MLDLFRDLLLLDPERLGLSSLDLFLPFLGPNLDSTSPRDLDLSLFKGDISLLTSLLDIDLSFLVSCLEIGTPLFKSLF